MIRLRVWANVRPMGWFGHAAGEFFFEYDAQWLAQPSVYPLTPQFGLQAGAFNGHLVRSFFENLLPEGTALGDVVAALGLRDASTLDLLGRLGQELPGMLSLLPQDAQPEFLQTYRPLRFEALSPRLRSQQQLLVSNDQTTMTLAGAQEKMCLR